MGWVNRETEKVCLLAALLGWVMSEKNPCYSVNPSGPTPFMRGSHSLARESVEDFCQDLHPDPISTERVTGKQYASP